MAPLKALHIIVSGNVQGVFFRAHTKQWADSLGVKGWVKNLPDGSVEISAYGKKEALDMFLKLVRRGPPSSHVSALKIDESPLKKETNGFSIRY